jgi:F-box-like
MNLDKLPNEILVEIFSYCSGSDLLSLSSLCKKFNALKTNSKLIDKLRIVIDFGNSEFLEEINRLISADSAPSPCKKSRPAYDRKGPPSPDNPISRYQTATADSINSTKHTLIGDSTSSSLPTSHQEASGSRIPKEGEKTIGFLHHWLQTLSQQEMNIILMLEREKDLVAAKLLESYLKAICDNRQN